ncbi:MAG: uroporphyrinogen-III C-methyltransferase [Thiohalophilus sp.]|jgi:uroporphyrin-3 C-methyltransferase
MTDKDKQIDTSSQDDETRDDDPNLEESVEEVSGEAEPTPPRAKGSKGALFLALLALLATGALGAGGYYLWQQQQKLSGTQQHQNAALQASLKDLRSTLAAQNDRQDDELNKLLNQQKNLDDALQTLLKSSSHLRNDWLLTEAEYLIKLANHRLLLERDVTTAIVALQSADDRLHEVADPALLSIRKRVADDINALRSVPLPDLAGMSFTLSSLADDVERLPLATPDPKTHQQLEQGNETKKIESWRELPAAVWHDLKSLVVIRHHDEPIQPLLAPEQRFFLTQNLKLQLEQARLALLNGETQVYRERLQKTSQWIEQYFDTKQTAVKQSLEQLANLAEKDIHPKLPDISSTYEALVNYRESRRNTKPPANHNSKQPEKKDAPES